MVRVTDIGLAGMEGPMLVFRTWWRRVAWVGATLGFNEHLRGDCRHDRGHDGGTRALLASGRWDTGLFGKQTVLDRWRRGCIVGRFGQAGWIITLEWVRGNTRGANKMTGLPDHGS